MLCECVCVYCQPYHLEYKTLPLKYEKVLTHMAPESEFHVLILFVMALYVHHTHTHTHTHGSLWK